MMTNGLTYLQTLSKEMQQKLDDLVQNKFVAKGKKPSIHWKVII